MAQLSPATVMKVAAEVYGYELSAEAAASIARAVGALLGRMRALPAAVPGEPAFGYPNMLAEAESLRRR